MTVVVPLAVTLVTWLAVIHPLLNRLPFISSVGGSDTLAGALMLCRPHTVKGTLLASTAGYCLLCIYHSSTAHLTFLRVLISGVAANVFIVGINQLVDVESDRVNSKPLPLATGQLTWSTAERIVATSLLVAVTVGFLESTLWGSVISAMCIIGVVYSVPPFRLKRFALPAALCIVAARALLGTIGGVLVYSRAMGKELDDFVLMHLWIFTGVLVAFTTVIALMKDVPDMEGDVQEGVRSLSVVLGADHVSQICLWLLSSAYLGVISALWGQSLFGVITHVMGLIWLHARWIRDSCSSTKSTAMRNYFGTVWPLFYFEFFAYLAPIGADHIGLHVGSKWLGLLLGVEMGYLAFFPAGAGSGDTLVEEKIREKSGLDVGSLFRNLRLRGPEPTLSLDDSGAVAQSAVEMSVALNMHAKLTRLTGKTYRDAKKLAILCGDWLLARAVMALCETKSHEAIHEMGIAIATATTGDEVEITDIVMSHARKAKKLASR